MADKKFVFKVSGVTYTIELDNKRKGKIAEVISNVVEGNFKSLRAYVDSTRGTAGFIPRSTLQNWGELSYYTKKEEMLSFFKAKQLGSIEIEVYKALVKQEGFQYLFVSDLNDIVSKITKSASSNLTKNTTIKPAPKKVSGGLSAKKVEDVAVMYILTDAMVMTVMGGVTTNIQASDKRYKAVAEFIKKNLIDKKSTHLTKELAEELKSKLSIVSTIIKLGGGRVVVDTTKGLVTIDNKPVPLELANKLIDMLTSKQSDADLDAFAKFIDKVIQSNSFKVSNRLYKFLNQNQLQIDSNGDVVAFRVVNNRLYDKHTNTMDNSVGKVVSMPRSCVDDDDSSHCSNGLHVCAPKYIKGFHSCKDRLIVVKVNPINIVSIPTDYNGEKCRVCEFTVYKEIKAGTKEFNSLLDNTYNPDGVIYRG